MEPARELSPKAGAALSPASVQVLAEEFTSPQESPHESRSQLTRTVAALAASAQLRYALALATVVLSLLLRRMFDPFFGDRVVYSFLYPSLAFSAIYLGLGPSIAAALVGLIATDWLFVPPRGTLGVGGVSDVVEALTYAVLCVLIIAAGELNRRARRTLRIAHDDLEQREGALRLFNRELENRVAGRTAELQRAEESARQLGAQVLQMQDEERKRIARELHDSVGQMTALLCINLSRLANSTKLTQPEENLLADSQALAEGLAHDVRTISHLLHPPLLDEMGLPSALQWYIEGFSKRSGIATDLDLPPIFGRLPADCEIAIFRIIQEALTNVHRHSGSSQATVRLLARRA